MRVLTVRQPWAWAIIHGGKDVENRTRNIAGSYRGPIAIHAARAWDDTWRDAETSIELKSAIDAAGYPDLDFGAIIGVTHLVDAHHVTMSGYPERLGSNICWDDRTPPGQICSAWAEAATDGWHLRLADPRALTMPMPWRGALGLRELPADAAAEVGARL